jgi:hypothetical protein
MKQAVSVTLRTENVLWLRGQAAASAKGSLSEVLDRLVSEARTSGRTDAGAIRSVAGTIELPEEDPLLEEADQYIRGMFAASLRRPLMVREERPQFGAPRARRTKKARG